MLLGQTETDGVGQPLAHDPVQQLMGGAGAVDADQDLAPDAAPGPVAGDLPQRVAQDPDVVSGGIAAGVPGPEQH
jgi:hypothetical protein